MQNNFSHSQGLQHSRLQDSQPRHNSRSKQDPVQNDPSQHKLFPMVPTNNSCQLVPAVGASSRHQPPYPTHRPHGPLPPISELSKLRTIQNPLISSNLHGNGSMVQTNAASQPILHPSEMHKPNPPIQKFGRDQENRPSLVQNQPNRFMAQANLLSQLTPYPQYPLQTHHEAQCGQYPVIQSNPHYLNLQESHHNQLTLTSYSQKGHPIHQMQYQSPPDLQAANPYFHRQQDDSSFVSGSHSTITQHIPQQQQKQTPHGHYLQQQMQNSNHHQGNSYVVPMHPSQGAIPNFYQALPSVSTLIQTSESPISHILTPPPTTTGTPITIPVVSTPAALYTSFLSSSMPTSRPNYQPQSRNYYTKEQRDVLETSFSKQSSLTPVEKERLSILLDVPEKSVKIWFNNKKASIKRAALKESSQKQDSIDAVSNQQGQQLVSSVSQQIPSGFPSGPQQPKSDNSGFAVTSSPSTVTTTSSISTTMVAATTSASSSTAINSKKTKPFHYSKEQLVILQKSYSKTHYLKKPETKRLSAVLHLPEKKIIDWFQNRRKTTSMTKPCPPRAPSEFFTLEQVEILMKSFLKNKDLTPEEKKRLSQKLDCSEKRVGTWFRHKKYR